MSRKKNTGGAVGAENDTTKPKRTRPRSGSWTPVTRTFAIPGTDLTLDVEMYTVEFCGETIEVKHDRDGVAKANAWIKEIRERHERLAKIERLRRELAEMEETTKADAADGEPTA